MDSTFIKAFKQVVREELLKKNSVELEGLGRFELVHHKQHQEKNDEGQVVMMPPRDAVEFTPEKK